MSLRIQFDGATFHGRPTGPYPVGLFVGRGGFVGWEDGGTAGRLDDQPRGNAHGSHDAPVFLGPRLVTISGHAYASSPEGLLPLRDQVMSAGVAGPAEMAVTLQGATRRAKGRRLSGSFVDVGLRQGSRFRGEFELQVQFADPFTYGENRSFQGGVTVTPWHRGNFAAVPRVVVESGFEGGFWLDYAGRVFEVSQRTWWSADPIEVDMATGWVWQGGSLLRGVITRAETFTIPPAANEPLRLFGIGAGSGRVRVELTDTYI